MSVRSSVSNLTGSAPVWSTIAMSCASSMESRPVICARPPPMPPERLEVRVVDLWERPDLAVEHDREVLRRPRSFPRDPLGARDLLEPVATSSRELHRHDRRPAPPGLVSKSARVPSSLRSSPVICGTFGGLVLEEVVVGAVGRATASPAARADDGGLAARDDDHALGTAKNLAAFRELPVGPPKRLLSVRMARG